jgi:hypothetical protein
VALRFSLYTFSFLLTITAPKPSGEEVVGSGIQITSIRQFVVSSGQKPFENLSSQATNA